MYSLHDIADESTVERPLRRKSRLFVAAPDDHVRRRFEIGDLVAVYHVLVAGKVEHAIAGGPHRLPDGKQHGIAEPATDQHDRFVGRNFGRRPGGPHHHDRLAWFQQDTHVARAAHFQHDGGNQPAPGIDPGAGQREPFHRQARMLRI